MYKNIYKNTNYYNLDDELLLLGLSGINQKTKKLLKLVKITNNVSIIGFTAQIQSKIFYESDERNNTRYIEYIMLIPENAVLSHFQTSLGNNGILINSKCNQYTQPRNNENHFFSQDIFHIRFVNKFLPPKTKVTLSITMNVELKLVEQYIMQFHLPNIFKPLLPYEYTFDINTKIINKSIERITWKHNKNLIVTPSKNEELFFTDQNIEGDYVIYLYYEPSCHIFYEKGLGSDNDSFLNDDVIMINLHNFFQSNSISYENVIDKEIIFIVNDTTSTDNINKNIYNTLYLCLKSLPIHCLFNVYRCGTYYNVAFNDKSSKPCDTDTISQAINNICNNINGCYNNNKKDILEILNYIYNREYSTKTRQILLLTHKNLNVYSQNNNNMINTILKTIRLNADKTQLFIVNMKDNKDEHENEKEDVKLGKALAFAGRGIYHHLINYSLIQIMTKTMFCLNNILSPDITDIVVRIKYFNEIPNQRHTKRVKPQPPNTSTKEIIVPHVVFHSNPLIIYILENNFEEKIENISITYNKEGVETSINIPNKDIYYIPEKDNNLHQSYVRYCIEYNWYRKEINEVTEDDNRDITFPTNNNTTTICTNSIETNIICPSTKYIAQESMTENSQIIIEYHSLLLQLDSSSYQFYDTDVPCQTCLEKTRIDHDYETLIKKNSIANNINVMLIMNQNTNGSWDETIGDKIPQIQHQLLNRLEFDDDVILHITVFIIIYIKTNLKNDNLIQLCYCKANNYVNQSPKDVVSEIFQKVQNWCFQ